jgi:hypothetical protein
MAFVLAVSVACSATRSAAPPTEPAKLQELPSPEVKPTAPERIPCTLTRSAMPLIEGLSLGMTSTEVLNSFPGSSESAEIKSDLARPPSSFGGSQLMIRPLQYKAREAKEAPVGAATQISVSFLDGRVMSFHVTYNGPVWTDIDKFVEKVVAGTSLPAPDQWEPYAGLDNQMKTLTCSDVSIRVFAAGDGGNLNSVLVQDLEADNKLKERRRKAREQPKPTPGQ